MILSTIASAIAQVGRLETADCRGFDSHRRFAGMSPPHIVDATRGGGLGLVFAFPRGSPLALVFEALFTLDELDW